MFLQVALLPLCQKKDKMEFEPIKDMFAYLSPKLAKYSDARKACGFQPLEMYLMSQVVMNTMLLSPESGPDIWLAYTEKTGKEALHYTTLAELQRKLGQLMDETAVNPCDENLAKAVDGV